MPRKVPTWAQACAWIMAGFALALLVGFDANPVPQPQRVSALVARLDALEAANGEQAAAIDALVERVERLEAAVELTPTGSTAQTAPSPPAGEDSLPTVPDTWREGVTSDAILAYRYDPRWEITLDEPGHLNFVVDDEHVLLFNWDWSADMLDTLQDEAFLELFEGGLSGDDSSDVTLLDSGAMRLIGLDGYFWEMAFQFEDGTDVQVLSVIYACNERVSCEVTLMRLGRRSGFNAEERALLEIFATGVEFLNVGKATVTANANLRACPSVECEIVGRAIAGEIIEVVGRSADGSWYRLLSGVWIASSLVEGAPEGLPVLDDGSEL